MDSRLDVTYTRTAGPFGYDYAAQSIVTDYDSGDEALRALYLVGDWQARLDGGDWYGDPRREEYAPDSLTSHEPWEDLGLTLAALPGMQVTYSGAYGGVPIIGHSLYGESEAPAPFEGMDIVYAAVALAEEGDFVVTYELSLAETDGPGEVHVTYALEALPETETIELPLEAGAGDD